MILEYCDKSELDEKEKYWLTKYKEDGFSLYNVSEGGNGFKGVPMTEDHKEKISKALKGKKFSEEHKKNLKEYWNKNKKEISEETRKKMSLSHIGKESNHKGCKMSEESKEKIRQTFIIKGITNKGKHLSEETKRKIGDRNKKSVDRKSVV